jgi:HEPN domain-containing protein
LEDKVKYWLELSDYDFETAEAMLSSGRYLYVGFMCHQTIEKILKAYFTKIKKDTAPFTHSLSHLARKADLLDNLSDEQKETIDFLEPLNIETRYPTYKERLVKSLTKEKCEILISKTNVLRTWIKLKL